jgi:Tol biopolymer transport system component
MDADGNPRRLTDHNAADWSPVWSPDGTQIAFISLRDGSPEIYVMNADGSNPRRLTDNGAVGVIAWSPDGRHIAFTSNRDGNYEIYVMDIDGSNSRRLTNNRAVDGCPVWSPDGMRIAFASSRNGNYDIYVMDADGTNPRRLTNNNRRGCLAWSPDGAQIVFASIVTATMKSTYGRRWSNLRRLTDSMANDVFPVPVIVAAPYTPAPVLMSTAVEFLTMGCCPDQGYGTDGEAARSPPTSIGGQIAFTSDRDGSCNLRHGC